MKTRARLTPELRKYLKEGGTLGSLAERPRRRQATDAFPCEPAVVYMTQVEALATRLRRIGVKDVTIGISGGLDSALCLLVACGAPPDEFDVPASPRRDPASITTWHGDAT